MRGRVIASSLLALALGGCSPEPEALPPFGEAVIIVDTDAPVPALVSTLRLDIYDLDGNWLRSEDIPRSDPETWPFSFSVFTPDETQGREVLVRLRAFPDNKVRDYRGERFTPIPAPDDYPDRCPGAPPELTENKRLLRRDATGAPVLGDAGEPIDITPLEEPLPDLTIDRLLHLRIEPGVAGGLLVTLHGACFGAEANLFERESCIDEPQTYVAVEPVTPTGDTALPSSEVGTWPPESPCTAAVRETDDPLDAEVCADGGVFILGDLGVFGFGEFDAFPERVAAIPALRVDRYEVTVGRFRAWWDGMGDDAGLDPPFSVDDAPPDSPQSFCTWSDDPGPLEDHPINCISWNTARAYCQARGGDLPTEAQWEWLAAAAGRGRQDRFPFGSNVADCTRSVHARAESLLFGATECAELGVGPQSAAEARGDRTPVYDLVGMAGNVREWTRDEYRAYCSSGWAALTWDDPVCAQTNTSEHTVRGGDWTVSADLLLSAVRDQGLEAASTGNPRVGFRCVRPGNE